MDATTRSKFHPLPSCKILTILLFRMKKPRVSLKYMTMALTIEKESQDTTAPELAATYLNLCAIYSELGQHSEAIDKAVKSVMLIRNHLQRLKNFDEYKGNDLEKVIKSHEGDSDKHLQFLFRPRTKI